MKTKKHNIYELKKRDNDDFLLSLKKGISEFKWLQFSSDKEDYFLAQGGILSSLPYKRFLFVFQKKDIEKAFFSIEDKENKKLFSKKNKIILSGEIHGSIQDFNYFLDMLERRSSMTLE